MQNRSELLLRKVQISDSRNWKTWIRAVLSVCAIYQLVFVLRKKRLPVYIDLGKFISDNRAEIEFLDSEFPSLKHSLIGNTLGTIHNSIHELTLYCSQFQQ